MASVLAALSMLAEEPASEYEPSDYPEVLSPSQEGHIRLKLGKNARPTAI